MKKIAFFCLILLFALTGAFAAQARESLSLPAAGCQSLRIECGAGWLKVQGEEKLERIEVSAVLSVKGADEGELREFKDEYVTLSLEKKGDGAVLIARIDDGHALAKLFGSGRDARIDLDVRLPRGLALAVADGSGDLEIRSVAGGLDLSDGSGNIELRDISGGLRLTDGSGNARLTSIQGEIRIDDGSGDLYLADLKGDVVIDDGSGDIELKDASGDVEIEDGSGEIEVTAVGGSLEIDDGSGDIVIDGVGKDVTIVEAGSGGIQIRNVKGRVRK